MVVVLVVVVVGDVGGILLELLRLKDEFLFDLLSV